MNTTPTPKLIALTGGSGAGKSWLANRLCEEFADQAMSISLDDFYCDLSRLRPDEREKINFDHPAAIDWPLFERVLRELRNGDAALTPCYDFASHTLLSRWELRSPRPFIFVEGLWLLRTPRVRDLFELRIFLRCSESLRWQRRLARDCNERGRTADGIGEQFWNVVAPMHARFVEGQEAWADLVLEQPLTQTDLKRPVAAIRALRPNPATWTITSTPPAIVSSALLQSL